MSNTIGWSPDVFPFFNPDISLNNMSNDEELDLQWFALLHMSILSSAINLNGRSNMGFVTGWMLPRDYIFPSPYTVHLDVLEDLGVLDVYKCLGVAEDGNGRKTFMLMDKLLGDKAYKPFTKTSKFVVKNGREYIQEKARDWSPNNQNTRLIGPFPDRHTAEVYAVLTTLLPGNNTFTGVGNAWFPQNDVYNDNDLNGDNYANHNFQVTVGLSFGGGALTPFTAIQPLGSRPYVDLTEPTEIDTSKFDSFKQGDKYIQTSTNVDNQQPVAEIILRRMPNGGYYTPNSSYFLGRQEVEFTSDGSVIDQRTGQYLIDTTQVRTETLTLPSGDLLIQSYPISH